MCVCAVAILAQAQVKNKILSMTFLLCLQKKMRLLVFRQHIPQISRKRLCAVASDVPSWHALSDIGPAITLRGAQITEAILSGKKDIENRKVRLPVGCLL